MNAEQVIELLEAHVVDNCTAIDHEATFDAMLDECYSFENVGGPFACMTPSRVLKETDPTAYRCGVTDYMDSLGTVEVNGDDYDPEDAEKAKEEFIDKIDSDITDAENAIEEEGEQEGDYMGTDKMTELKAKLADLQADLKAANNHSF